MSTVKLVRGARQLLTLRGRDGPRRGTDLRNLAIIQDGAVLIAGGLIRDVGPTRRLENLALARNAEEIDATGRVVMPGFVDSHTHVVGGPARMLDYEMRLAGATHAEIAQAGGGILALARAIQDLSPRTLEAQAMRVLEEAVRHGTTTLEAKSGFGLTEAGEIKILRVHSMLQKLPIAVVSTFFVSGVPLDFQEKPGQHIDWICAHVLPLVKRRKLAEFADIRCAGDAFTPEHVLRYLTAARQLGLALKLHAGHGAKDGWIQICIELGVASVDDVSDVTREDAALLAQSQTVVTLLPGCAFYLGTSRYAPSRMLIDSGVAVALATGYNPETSPSQNMQMTIALACRNMDMTPAEAISAATINAAYAVRRGSSVGSLENGKSADLLILDVPDYREIPYHFGVNLVDLVMKSGATMVQRSEVKWPVH